MTSLQITTRPTLCQKHGSTSGEWRVENGMLEKVFFQNIIKSNKIELFKIEPFYKELVTNKSYKRLK